MTPAQASAVKTVAQWYEWDQMSERQLGLLLWALFRYYAGRLGEVRG